jgi:hypothetical protein
MFVLGAMLDRVVLAGSYELLNGTKLEGDPVSFDQRGVVVKLTIGEFAPREAWTNFSQAGLKELVKLAKAKPFAELYILEDEEDTQRPRSTKKDLPPKPVVRLDRPSPRAGFGTLFTSPLTGLLLFLIYAANVYAGFEIARYRNYPPPLVCGIAAVAPILGPGIFLCLPTKVPEAVDEQAETAAAGPTETIQLPSSARAAAAAAEATAGAAGGAPGQPQPIRFTRGQTMFNRRFFETKLAGFLRTVPGEAEKDMVLCVSSARGNFVGQRISRIMTNEISLLVKKGDATTEVMIPFTEITEIQIRHQDSAT